MEMLDYRIKAIWKLINFIKRQTCFGLLSFIAFSALYLPVKGQIVAQSNSPKADANYKIGIGDVLKVVIFKQELLSLDNVRVGNEGTIRMPMLQNEIVAACLTETELATKVTEQYKKYILNPQVYVAVKEFNSNPVALVGAVVMPGRFQLQRPMRLLELLTYVNGPTLNAGKNVEIIRSSSVKRCEQYSITKIGAATSNEDQPEIISLPLAEVMSGNENANPYLEAGDVIRINEAEQLFAYVIGTVKSAATINLKEPVTLSKAIAIAGGVSEGAQTDKIKISRKMPGTLAKTEIIVNYKNINKQKQEDILLQPDDIVDVPGPSGSRKLFKDILRTIVPVVTRAPVLIP